jgi:hypothetical protein
MEPWTRDDTRYWIEQVENRVDDIDFYLQRTTEWCEDRDIYDNLIVISCMIVTVLWVTEMRQESISKREIYELIGIRDWYNAPEEAFALSDQYKELDIDELLEIAVTRQS